MTWDRDTEIRRNDPELRAKVQTVLEVRAAAAKKALALLEEAAMVLRAPYSFNENDIYERNINETVRAATRLSSDLSFITRNVTDVYVGNMAVGELGEHILALGDEFEEEIERTKERAGL